MKEVNSKTLRGSALLFLAALIWGAAFVAQSVGMEYMGPFGFNGVRNLIGSAVLLPCIALIRKVRGEEKKPSVSALSERKTLIAGGAVCGFFLFIASNLQQVGIKYTTVGKAGFITAMYIVIVPLLGIFLGRRAGRKLWISVFLAVIGLYLLSMTDSLALGEGDFCVLLCAFAFSFQITAVDYYAARTDGLKLACLEFLVCGVLSLILTAFTEKLTVEGMMGAGIPLLYAGVLSCGVAYTLQIIGQRDVNPALASLIMSLESVISALAGWVILGQKLHARELAGCALMFAAIILAQLPEKRDENIRTESNGSGVS